LSRRVGFRSILVGIMSSCLSGRSLDSASAGAGTPTSRPGIFGDGDRSSPAQTMGSGIGLRVRVERTAAAADTDAATRQTVEKMCEYIRAGVADPMVQRCAAYAWRRFGMALPSLDMKAWAVFWWVKHCIRFRQDEATMFRVGLQDEQDLLIEPALLVRMKDPAEDCDGFTMLGSAMLSILGVPVCIATVAVSPDDSAQGYF
jgi:hypothetical protein